MARRVLASASSPLGSTRTRRSTSLAQPAHHALVAVLVDAVVAPGADRDGVDRHAVRQLGVGADVLGAVEPRPGAPQLLQRLPMSRFVHRGTIGKILSNSTSLDNIL